MSEDQYFIIEINLVYFYSAKSQHFTEKVIPVDY